MIKIIPKISKVVNIDLDKIEHITPIIKIKYILTLLLVRYLKNSAVTRSTKGKNGISDLESIYKVPLNM
jgi:hypothetical protein